MARGKMTADGKQVKDGDQVQGPMQRLPDMTGKATEVPAGLTREQLGGKFVDQSVPRPDVDDRGNENVPEFVNVTNKLQIMHTQYFPMGKVKVIPWGVLSGAQYRSPYATKCRNWKNPPFLERELGEDGEYDPEYLLTVKQTVDLIRLRRGGKNRHEIKLARAAVLGQHDNGKFDPKDPEKRIRDDRPEVTAAAMEQSRFLEMRLQLHEKLADSSVNDPAVERLQKEILEMRRGLGYKIEKTDG